MVKHVYQPPSAPLLYHYTDGHALLSILEHGELWATKIQYLNDSKEFLHAIDIGVKVLEELLKSAEATPQQASFLARFKEELPKLERLTHHGMIRVFVVSFSAKADDLSQWRGYCANGNGYCIGFNKEAIDQLAKSKENLSLYPCIYNHEEQRDAIWKLVTEVLQHDIGKPPNPSDPFDEPVVEAFIGKFVELAPRLKDEKFEAEEEWRLIYRWGAPTISTWRFGTTPEGSEFKVFLRQGRTSLIPYAKVNLRLSLSTDSISEPLPIKELWIGPGQNMVLSWVAAMELFKLFPGNSFNIAMSNVPYRDI